MLKLNSSNGKFDIVFAGDILLGGKKKLELSQTESIQKSKNTNPKSQLLQKDEQSYKKSKKCSPVKNEDEKQKKVVTPSKNVGRRANVKEKEKKIANNEERIKKPPDKKNSRKTVSKEEKSVNPISKTKQTKKVINKNESNKNDYTCEKDIVKTEHPTTPVTNGENPNVDDNMYKRSSFQNGGITNNRNIGVISREDLNSMFSGFFEESKPKKVVEPINPPDSTFPNLDLNNKQDLSLNHRRYVEEDYDPWGRPGCGAPRSKYRDVANYNSSASPPAPPRSNRDNLIRNLQSHTDEEYNPWGKPGCGAPLKDRNQNVVADLKSWMTDKRRAQNYPEKIQEQVERDAKVQSSFEVKKTTPEQLELNVSFSSTFARGQGKSQIELQEIQKRRQKELEHQVAIKQQVEEKRRLKRLEKERELKEEQEAENRFRREQEQIREMAEKEKQKQREQEEKMRRKQEMLAESIKKANLESKKAKDEMRHGSPRNKSLGNSKPNRSDDLNYVRRLHHDDDVIVPAATTGFSTNDNKERNSKDNAVGKVQNAYTDVNIDGNKTFTQSPKEIDNTEMKHFPSDMKLKNKYIDERSVGNKSNLNIFNDEDNETIRKNSFSSNSKNKNMKVEKERSLRDGKNDPKVINELPKHTDVEPVFNDYMIPFHRTQTADLLDNHPKPLLTSETKKGSKSPKRHPDAESPSLPPNMTSSRQQQIISQLHALRQGLMQKEREYVLEKYS